MLRGLRSAPLCQAIVSRRLASTAQEKEPVTVTERTTDRRSFVISKVSEEVAEKTNRLFAVVYINRRQYKVSQDDIIHVDHNQLFAVGEKLKLEKVLLVGGENFTLIGRPMLDASAVTVNATVIEKTYTQPEVKYIRAPGKKIHNLLWWSRELNVLRINEITVDQSALGPH
ncbi:50S ribosomal protein L21 [Aphelenchoides avenae]|nr:50S ribosomal protein L21 [Aphelenchus avenae]